MEKNFNDKDFSETDKYSKYKKNEELRLLSEKELLIALIKGNDQIRKTNKSLLIIAIIICSIILLEILLQITISVGLFSNNPKI